MIARSLLRGIGMQADLEFDSYVIHLVSCHGLFWYASKLEVTHEYLLGLDGSGTSKQRLKVTRSQHYSLKDSNERVLFLRTTMDIYLQTLSSAPSQVPFATKLLGRVT